MIGDEIDALAAQKKDIQDCIAFATWYSCNNLVLDLQDDTMAYSDELILKQMETDAEIRKLLMANPNLAPDEATLRAMLLASFPGSPQDGAPTGNIVAFDNAPLSCANENRVQMALTGLHAARINLDQAENFCAYVKDQMGSVCTNPFEERVMSYMSQITGHTQQLNQIVEWLLMAYQELGNPITQKDFVANFRAKFEIAMQDPSYMSSFVDPITIPEITSECQTAIDEGGYIETLMMKAEETQDMFDFNVYLTEEVCSLIDARIQQIITNNAQILDQSQADIQRALQEMYFFGEPTMSRDNFYRLQRDLYESLLLNGEITPEDPGFSNPITMYPDTHCTGKFTWDLLNTLVQETIDSLTYEAWLEGRLNHQCDQAEPYFNDRLDILNSRMDLEMLLKDQKLDELYPILAPEGQTREEFESINRGMFETAKLEGQITSTFFFPLFNYPDSCGQEVIDLEAEVLAKAEATRELIDCNMFTSEILCGRLDQKVLSCIDQNTIDARNYQELINMQLAALFPVTANEDEDFDMFKARMQSEFNAATRHGYLVTMDIGDRCSLPENIPDTCAEPGANMVDFDSLNTVLQTLKTLANYNAFLEDRMQEAVQNSLDQHLTRRALLWGEITAEEDKKLDLIESLYNDFDFAAIGVSLEQFIREIEQEFTMAQDNGAILDPVMVDREFPPVPVGQEAAVQEERDLIDQKASTLEDLKDFNNFVKDHVCGSRAMNYMEQCAEVDTAIEQTKDMKMVMLQNVYDTEKSEGESFDDFCEKLMDTFDAEFGGDFPEPSTPSGFEYPDVIMPEDCDEATAAQASLIEKLDELNKLLSFKDWLGPKITDNEDLLQQCMEDQATIEQLIKEQFPRWTECIANKIDLLNMLYDQTDMTMTFDEFIEATRAEFDELKDNNKIILADPEFPLPEVDGLCPEETQNQYTIGLAYRDVLQDCLSYLGWCELQKSGVCDIEAYEMFYSDNLPMLTDTEDAQAMKLHDLFTLKVEAVNNGIMADRMEAMQTFTDDLMADFNEDAPEPATVSISLDPVPQLCGPEARTAGQTAADLVDDLIAATTFNNWLDGLLSECCEQLAMSYQGLVDLENMMDRVGTLRSQRTSILDQLEGFKNTVPLPRAEWEASLGYVPENIFPDLTLDHALVDTPQSCIDMNAEADMAAQELYGIARDIAMLEDENAWLMDQLVACIENANNDLMMQATALLNDFNMLQMQIMAEVESLAVIEGVDPADADAYQAALAAMFQQALDDGYPLVDPRTPVVNVPEDADMMTQMVADQVAQGIQDVQRQETYLQWLQQRMQLSCQTFVSQINAIIDPTRLSDLDSQIEEKQSNLFMLMPSPFPGNTSPLAPSNLAAAMMMLDTAFDAAEPGLVPVPSNIGTPTVPEMCSTYTQQALDDLAMYSMQVSQKLTECEWLDEQIAQECADDLGTLESITTNSLGSMGFLANKNDQCFDTIESISSMTEAGILGEFDALFTADAMRPPSCSFLPDIMPACGAELVGQEQATVALCEEFDRLIELDDFLGGKKVAACAEQSLVVIEGSNTILNLPGCPTLDDNWAVLYQCEGEGFNNEAVFRESILMNQFDPVYDSFTLAREDVGVMPVQVPDICTDDQMQRGEDLNNLIEDATRTATLCIWLEGQVSDACDDKKVMLEALLSDNQPRLDEAEARSATLLQNLFLLSSSSNLAQFREKKLGEYEDADRNLNTVPVGINIPSVPERCRAVTNDCLTDLLNFVQSLRVEIDFANWLEEELSQMCIDDVLTELVNLDMNINTALNECTTTNVPALQASLYSFEDPSTDQQAFTDDLSSQFDMLFAANQIMGADTPFSVPLIPDICMQQPAISSLLMTITADERALSMCLAEEIWLQDMLAAMCEPKAQMLADDKVNFEFELRIEQFANNAKEDDLALCRGEDNTEAFRMQLQLDLAMATDTPMGTTDLVVGDNMGCSSLDDALSELEAIRQMVIDERTYKNFLEAQLAECTSMILDQLADATTALETVDASMCLDSPGILDFKDVLGMDGESDDDFKARMIAERGAADLELYPLIDSTFGIDSINPLPTSASANELQAQADYNALLLAKRAEATLCGDMGGWMAAQASAVCMELQDALDNALTTLQNAQNELDIDLENKIMTLYTVDGATKPLDEYEDDLRTLVGVDTSWSFTPDHQFVGLNIEDNSACDPAIDASAYRAALDTYNEDYELAAYVMDQLSETCDALDVNADRVDAMTLRQELMEKNAVLEGIILDSSVFGTVDEALAAQGLTVDSPQVVGEAQTADIDLSGYQACQIDITDLESDIAAVNLEYRRCKMLEIAATMTLTDTLVQIINLRDSGTSGISEMDLDLSIQLILDSLFELSGEADQMTFELALEMQLQNMGQITMLAQTGVQISADLEQLDEQATQARNTRLSLLNRLSSIRSFMGILDRAQMAPMCSFETEDLEEETVAINAESARLQNEKEQPILIDIAIMEGQPDLLDAATGYRISYGFEYDMEPEGVVEGREIEDVPVVLEGEALTEVQVQSGCSQEVEDAAAARNQALDTAEYVAARCEFFEGVRERYCASRIQTHQNAIDSQGDEIDSCRQEIMQATSLLRSIDTANTDLDEMSYAANLARCYDLVVARSPLSLDPRCMTYTSVAAPINIVTTVESLPDSCDNYSPGFKDLEVQLRVIRATLSDAVNEKAWIQGQLGDEPCPRSDEILSQTLLVVDLVAEAQTAQGPLLQDLYQFKEIDGDDGSTALMKERLFDSLFLESNPLPTRPLVPAIEVPDVPFYCPAVTSETDALTEAITMAEREQTFTLFLQQSLDSCCDSLAADTQETIDDARARISELEGDILAKAEVLAEFVDIAGIATYPPTAEGWLEQLANAELPPPTSGSEFEIFQFDPVTCNAETQTLVQFTLPTLALQVEALKQDLAYLTDFNDDICPAMTTYFTDTYLPPITLLNAEEITFENCADARAALAEDVIQSTDALTAESTLDEVRALVATTNNEEVYDLQVPSMSEAATECCETAAGVLQRAMELEQCADEMENFNAYLSDQCMSTLTSLNAELSGIDVDSSNAALSANQDFLQYGSLNEIGPVFESIKAAALAEEGCSVDQITPLTYDYCPTSLADDLNNAGASIASAQTVIAENDQLAICLMNYAERFCEDDIADYITNVVEDEESLTPFWSDEVDTSLDLWIARAPGDPVVLEAQLRATECFQRENATLDARVDEVHPASDVMLLEACQAGEAGMAALLRYNTAYSANDADAKLALWAYDRHNTVTATQCQEQLYEVKQTLSQWNDLSGDGFLAHQTMLFNDFFLSLSSTVATSQPAFFMLLEDGFEFMANSEDLLPIPDVSLEYPCNQYDQLQDNLDIAEALQTEASLAQQKMDWYQTQVDLACLGLEQAQSAVEAEECNTDAEAAAVFALNQTLAARFEIPFETHYAADNQETMLADIKENRLEYIDGSIQDVMPFSTYAVIDERAESITFGPLEYCTAQGFDGDEFLEARRSLYDCQRTKALLMEYNDWQCEELEIEIDYQLAMFQPLQEVCDYELALRKREFYELEINLNEIELGVTSYDDWESSVYSPRRSIFLSSREAFDSLKTVPEIHGAGLDIYIPDSLGNCDELQTKLDALNALVISIPACDQELEWATGEVMEQMTTWTDVLDAIEDIRVDRTNVDGTELVVEETSCAIVETVTVTDLCEESFIEGDLKLFPGADCVFCGPTAGVLVTSPEKLAKIDQWCTAEASILAALPNLAAKQEQIASQIMAKQDWVALMEGATALGGDYMADAILQPYLDSQVTLRVLTQAQYAFSDPWMLTTSRDKGEYECTDPTISDDTIAVVMQAGLDLYNEYREAIINDQWAAAKCTQQIEQLNICSLALANAAEDTTEVVFERLIGLVAQVDPGFDIGSLFALSTFSFTESDYVCQEPGEDFCAAALAEADAIQDGWCGYVYKENLEIAKQLSAKTAAGLNLACYFEWFENGPATDRFTQAELCNRLERQRDQQHRQMLLDQEAKLVELDYLSRGFFVEQLLDTCVYEDESEVVWTEADPSLVTLEYVEIAAPEQCTFEELLPSFDALFGSIMSLEQQLVTARMAYPIS